MRWCFVVVLSVAFLATFAAADKKRVLVWMCLEVCGGNSTSISSNLQQISANRDTLTAVSFEKYNLGPRSELRVNNLTEVTQTIQSYGLETWPMVSSYPYPPQFILWMREVFRNPQPFIQSCVAEAKKYGYTGFNIDWEPAVGGTDEDALLYAKFLNTLATELHRVDVKVSVDMATWSNIWNLTALAQTSVDHFLDMGTYTNSDSSFLNQLETAIAAIGTERLGVGLEVLNAETGVPLPADQVQWRIDQVESHGCNEIDVWDEPLPDYWWDMLAEFANS